MKCTFVKSALSRFQIVLCNNLLIALDFLMAGALVAGISALVLVVCGIKAKKRFNKNYSRAFITEMFIAMEGMECSRMF